MKTKSKRFLNLATLCLALLGTTLLMTRPVKAEIVVTHQQSSDSSTLVNSSDEDGSSERTEQAGYDGKRDRKRGYGDGYEFGRKSDNRDDLDITKILIPQDIIDTDEYKDGYEEGFGAGWHDAHPITSFIEMAWQFLTDIFGGWFGSNNSSQSQ
ncbi:hypothetical protein [Streptococcus pyogenes]|uniref:hypothetical protein n=1 Tax=Streptococcus pyogenes TaxID=1314 RepID=UPI00109BF925|nr:hypothetical protein ETT71_02210 [Streptococcus pyogenes]VGQ18960.1 hypothetical membrane associated protein [Streptococcus pyogenes]VGQ47487.1 hypothetical membrane associated protein [Streptococcus pyogenes]VGQ82768.1 hypothetical membrane associated protein [Streptococcus pyogenes]VGV33841.1 Uncharacterised protein [Streptococcus pyogenes]